MTTTLRKVAWVAMFTFIAAGAISAATLLAQSTSPETARDPDDPQLAGRFSGRVTGPDGQPLAGAQIFVVPFDGSDGKPSVRAQTGADGRFEFDAPDMTETDLDGLPAPRHSIVIATADGYGPDWTQRWGRNRSTRRPVKGIDLEFQLVADDVPIHGRFVDPDGRPLAEAHVRLTGLMIPRDGDLDAHLEREVKRSALGCSTGYQRSLWQVATVPGLATETRTDADGRFTLHGLGRDRIAQLTVAAPSVVDTDLTVMTRDVPDVRIRLGDNGSAFAAELPEQMIRGAGFTLQLEPGRSIKGRVIDRDTREPIPGMWVGPTLHPAAGVSASKYPWVTDEQGRFTVTGLRPYIETQRIIAVAPPGVPYQNAGIEVDGDSEAVIVCPRGIPFRLKLIDEQGRPVEAEVTYQAVWPNPHFASLVPDKHRRVWPSSPAARRADGTYDGFVLPGPGAVVVKAQGGSYRPAHVEPKAFFAPGRMQWTELERRFAYGTKDTVATVRGQLDQNDYEAIVLVNPAPEAEALQLSATVMRDRPREVTLLDPEGQPIVGVQAHGMTSHRYNSEPPLRAASFPLVRLHPDRARHITFFKQDRRLIGFLQARGRGDAPYTVRMQPWAALSGRILDDQGEPLSGAHVSVKSTPEADRHIGAKTNRAGQFQIEKLVPGHRYSATVVRGNRVVGTAFEELVLQPGEVRKLRDVRVGLLLAQTRGTDRR